MSVEELKEVSHLPGCIAQYEPEDTVCNEVEGTYECQECDHTQTAPDEDDIPDKVECPECGKEMHISRPCAYRDICAGFKQYLADNGEERDEYLDIHENDEGGYCMAAETTNAEFIEFCITLIDDYGIEDGQITRTPEPEEESEEDEEATEEGEETAEGEEATDAAAEPSKSKPKKGKPKPKPKEPKSQKVNERREALWELFGHFMENLYENLGENRRNKSDQKESPGQLYISDHRSSGYVSVYCKTNQNRDTPLVLMLLKPRNMTMDIEMPFEPDALAKALNKPATKKFGEITSISDGRFKSKMKGFDKEKLAMLAEFIGQVVKKKIIELPAV